VDVVKFNYITDIETMGSRDFSAENGLTLLFRGAYAFRVRLRGLFYSFFFKSRANGLTVGPGIILVNSRGISLGDNIHIGRFARMESYDNVKNREPKVRIGAGSNFGDLFHISACNSIVIGKNCLFASKVMVIDFGHGRASDSKLREIAPQNRPKFSKSGITIGNNVWVGEGVTIYAGARVPDGAVIPANSFVDGSFNKYV
jgi:acetyltransferase-like isoleucine patch superfamily enzyme